MYKNRLTGITILIISILLAFNSRMKAVENWIYFGKIPDESGLSQKTISCIFQDNKGFLWFGTRDGLNRYDGYSFEVFRNDESDSTTISNNNIWSIAEDGRGDLWIATDNGLNCYHYSSNNFTRYYKKADKSGISNNKIGSLHCDNNGRIWIGTEQGIDMFDSETGNFIKTTLDGILFNNRIISVLCDSYGKVWIGTLQSGLIQYDPETGKYQIFRDMGFEHTPGGNPVRTIFEDSRRNLWIGTRAGLCMHNARDNSFQHFGKEIFRGEQLSNDGIRCIAEDTEKNLLIGTNEGLNILNPETGNLSIFNSSRNILGNINHFYIYSMLVDRAGTVWLGSYLGGINFYNKFNQQFRYIDPGSKDQIIYGGVGPLAEKNGMLWIGTGGGGLFCYDRLRNSYNRYQLDQSFASNVIKSIFIRNDTIYLGDEDGELLLFDIRKKKVVKSIQVSNNPILQIYKATGNKLFLCVRDSTGIRIYDPRSSGIVPFSYRIPGDQRKMLFPYSICMEKENDSIYWIGTRYMGMYRYNLITNSAIRYGHNINDTHSLRNNQVNIIYSGLNNTLWLGTNGGLSLFDKTTGHFIAFDEKKGLSNRVVLGILPDNEGCLWISTLTGISRFDPITTTFKNYTYGNGFPLQEPSENSFIKFDDGTLCFGSNNGLVTFHPGKLISNEYAPPPVITEFRLLTPDHMEENSRLHRKFIPDNDNVTLKYNQSSFIITYTALNYVFPERNQYAYMLEGFDQEWNNVDKQRIAIYTNLHAGNYRFKVKASNNDGVWNENFLSLNIRILPPPWLAWYAYVFYFIFFAGLSFLLILFIKLENRVRIKQLEKENLEQAHQMRIRMFTNFSHELRTPLTLIIGPVKDLLERTDIIDSIREQLNLIQQNSQRLLLIVSQLMDFRKQESGKMQLKALECNFAFFMKEISLVFSDLARKQKINYLFSTCKENILLWFDRLLLEKVFFNLLSNAFKNTPEGGEISIMINIRTAEELKNFKGPSILKLTNNISSFAEVVISDTGRGISEGNIEKIFDPFFQVNDDHKTVSVGTGIGLSLSKGIVELHSGTITVESRQNMGARFSVFLPIGKNHLHDNEIVSDSSIGEYHIPDLIIYDNNQPEKCTPSQANPEWHTVLIIEDNPEVRNYIFHHLGLLYNLILADNGDEGFIKAVEEMPDLILSDVLMPGINGLELCTRLKNDINTCHIPVILLTALTDFEQIRRGFEVGSDDYITKPFDPGTLKMKIDSLICNRERLRKSFSNKFLFGKNATGNSAHDKEFLDRTFEVLDKYIADQSFDLDLFSSELGMSRANLYRKIKALTDFAPNELINNYRLKTALRLLQENGNTISEISYRVGFSSPAYFSNCFKKSYGVSPSEYAGRINSGKLPD